MKVMAIDYGDARTGVAISDALGWMTGQTTVIHSWKPEKTAEEVARLEQTTGMKPVLWDERRTTIEAHQILNEGNYHGKKRKNTVDAVAASLILEGYLAYLRNHKE